MVGRTQFLLETSQGIQTPPGHLSRTRSKQNISGVIAMIMIKIYSKRNKSVLLWVTVSQTILSANILIFINHFALCIIILYYIILLL